MFKSPHSDQKPSEIVDFRGLLVRVVWLEQTTFCSRTRRATPGYSLFCHDPTASGKNKDFSVCGHSCGQRRFYTAFGNRGKSRKRRCHNAFWHFCSSCPGYSHSTPKVGALHLDIQFPDIMVRQRRKLRKLNSELCSHRLSAPRSRIKAPPRITARRTGRTGTLAD